MKKPLNYLLQMYRDLAEMMCGFSLFFACFRGFCTIFAAQF